MSFSAGEPGTSRNEKSSDDGRHPVQPFRWHPPIWVPLLGHIGSHMDNTSGLRGHAKPTNWAIPVIRPIRSRALHWCRDSGGSAAYAMTSLPTRGSMRLQLRSCSHLSARFAGTITITRPAGCQRQRCKRSPEQRMSFPCRPRRPGSHLAGCVERPEEGAQFVRYFGPLLDALRELSHARLRCPGRVAREIAEGRCHDDRGSSCRTRPPDVRRQSTRGTQHFRCIPRHQTRGYSGVAFSHRHLSVSVSRCRDVD